MGFWRLRLLQMIQDPFCSMANGLGKKLAFKSLCVGASMTPFEFAPEFVFDSACFQKRLALIPACASSLSRDT